VELKADADTGECLLFRMTVEAVQSDGTLRYVWFREDGKQDRGVFALVALHAAKAKN